MSFRLLAATLALALSCGAASAQSTPTRSDLILDRFRNANHWRDHVMVVGHRAGVRENGVVVRPENSLQAIRAAIDMGLEMVELDVEETADGAYIVLHDSWLERTTSCAGRVIKRTLAELRSCRLRLGDFGPVTEERIPTLRQALTEAKDQVLVNIDNKREATDLVGIVGIARELGMEDQVVIKQNLWSMQKVQEASQMLAQLNSRTMFMPIIADDAIRDPAFVDAATATVGANAVEMIAWRRQAGPLTENGGPLFTARMRAVAARNDLHLWMNTYAIVNKPAGYLSGGRGDEMATVAASPDDVYGFWIDRGVTIIQTDEPKTALNWLEAKGYRRPYTGAGEAVAARASTPSL